MPMQTASEIISIAVTCLAGLFGLIGLFIGLGRRTFRSLIRLGTIILAAVIAALIASPIASAVYGTVGNLINGLLSESLDGSLAALAQSSTVADLIAVVPSVLIAVVTYVPLFIVLSLLMLIPYAIICHFVLGKKKEKTAEVTAPETEPSAAEIIVTPMEDKKPKKKSKSDFPCDRLVGMVVGAVAGLLVCSFIFAPVCGIIGLAQNVVPAFVSEEDASAEAAELVESLGNHWFIKATNLYSGLLLGAVTKATVDGQEVEISGELNTIVSILSTLPPTEDGELEIQALLPVLPDIIDKLAASELLCAVAAGLLKEAGEAWKNGEEFLDVEKPELDPALEPLFDKMISLFASGSADDFSKDLKTVASLVRVMNDHGITQMLVSEQDEEPDLSSFLTDKTLVPDMINVVMNNEHTKALIPSIVNLGIGLLGEALNLPESDASLYDQLIEKLTQIVNDKPSKKNFVSSVKTALSESGADVSDQLADILAEGLYEEFKKVNNVTIEAIESFMDEVFAAESVKADEPLFIFAASSNVNAIRQKIAKLDSSARQGCEKLQNKATFRSTKITVEKIKVNDAALSSLSSEELKKEVTQLSAAVNSAIKFVDGLVAEEGKEISIADLDLKALGSAVDGLMSSKLLGDSAENLLGAVLESPMVTDIIPNAKETLGDSLIEGVKEGKLNFENVFEASQKAASLVSVFNDDSLSDAERTAAISKNVTWLLENMSVDTANSIKAVISADLLKTFGLKEKEAVALSTVLGVLLDELAAASMSGDKYEKEAKAIETMLSMALASNEKDSDKEIIRALFDSEILLSAAEKSVEKLGMDPLGQTDSYNKKELESYQKDITKDLKETFDEFYPTASDKQSFRKALITLGKFMGVDATKDVNSWAK